MGCAKTQFLLVAVTLPCTGLATAGGADFSGNVALIGIILGIVTCFFVAVAFGPLLAMVLWSDCFSGDDHGPRQELGQHLADDGLAHASTAEEAAAADDSHAKIFSPALTVPEGMEFVFVVREVITGEQQQIVFPIVDLGGQPLCKVYVSESESHSSISVTSVDEELLGFVRTEALYQSNAGVGLDFWGKGSSQHVSEVCRPGGRAFCTLQRLQDERGVAVGYALKRCDDINEEEPLFTFTGDFQENTITGVGPAGQTLCSTRQTSVVEVGSYEVCVASGVDAGLVICGLLAIQKAERCAAQRHSVGSVVC